MCLAVPGKIVTIQDGVSPAARIGTVDFQGSQLDVSLQLVPEAAEGDWVLVHAGFALNTLAEAEAMETWSYLAQLEPDADPGAMAGDSASGDRIDG